MMEHQNLSMKQLHYKTPLGDSWPMNTFLFPLFVLCSNLEWCIHSNYKDKDMSVILFYTSGNERQINYKASLFMSIKKIIKWRNDFWMFWICCVLLGQILWSYQYAIDFLCETSHTCSSKFVNNRRIRIGLWSTWF